MADEVGGGRDRMLALSARLRAMADHKDDGWEQAADDLLIAVETIDNLLEIATRLNKQTESPQR